MVEKSLTDVDPEEEVEISHINGGWIMQARLKEMGIAVGRRIKKISRIGVKGPVIILANRAQVAVGAGMASRIMVKIRS